MRLQPQCSYSEMGEEAGDLFGISKEKAFRLEVQLAFRMLAYGVQSPGLLPQHCKDKRKENIPILFKNKPVIQEEAICRDQS